jgi:hypothetical protein
VILAGFSRSGFYLKSSTVGHHTKLINFFFPPSRNENFQCFTPSYPYIHVNFHSSELPTANVSLSMSMSQSSLANSLDISIIFITESSKLKPLPLKLNNKIPNAELSLANQLLPQRLWFPSQLNKTKPPLNESPR